MEISSSSHGWVDDCIEVWFQAHEMAHPGQIKRKDVRGIAWFEPGQWILKADPFDWPGAEHSHEHGGQPMAHHDDEVKTLEQVMAMLKEVNGRPTAGFKAIEPVLRLPGFARFSDIQLLEGR